MIQSYQMHAPPLSGSAAGGSRAGGAGGARGSVGAGCVNAWKQASVAWRRRQTDTPSALVAAEGLESGARVRCFFLCDGDKLSDTRN